MTNADTAVLAEPFMLAETGLYRQSTGALSTIGGYVGLWSRTAYSEMRSRMAHSRENQLSPELVNDRGMGVGVRCAYPSFIFSPEAMGWPGELLQKRTRRC